MKKNAITFPQLCARLERAVHYPCGVKGLEILIYGWINKYHLVSYHTLWARENTDGEKWLSYSEAQSFSGYCGYDLTHD